MEKRRGTQKSGMSLEARSGTICFGWNGDSNGRGPTRKGRSNPVGAPQERLPENDLQSGEIRVEVGDGLDAAEVVFEGNVFIGGVRVFVGEAEAEQNARHFEGVVHLRYERDGTTLANENGLLAEALF